MAKKFKPGNMWSEDFDYDGMLEYGKKIDGKTSDKQLEKYADSMEDVNYHTLAKPLFDYQVATSGDKERIKKYYLRQFKRGLSDQLAELGEERLSFDDIYKYKKGGKVDKELVFDISDRIYFTVIEELGIENEMIDETDEGTQNTARGRALFDAIEESVESEMRNNKYGLGGYLMSAGIGAYLGAKNPSSVRKVTDPLDKAVSDIGKNFTDKKSYAKGGKIVWVGDMPLDIDGREELTKEEAERLAKEWKEKGYDDVIIEDYAKGGKIKVVEKSDDGMVWEGHSHKGGGRAYQSAKDRIESLGKKFDKVMIDGKEISLKEFHNLEDKFDNQSFAKGGVTEKDQQSIIQEGTEIEYVDENGDYRAIIGYKEFFGRNMYYIWFNGKMVHSSITYKSMLRKLNQLKEDYKLEYGGAKYAKGGSTSTYFGGGNYLEIFSEGDKLIVKPTEDGLEELRDGNDVSNLFEDISSNSEIAWHDDLGMMGFGLTEASGLTDGFYYEDDGSFTNKGNEQGSGVYYFNDYMLRSPEDDLMNRGELVLFRQKRVGEYAKGGKLDEYYSKMVDKLGKKGAFERVLKDSQFGNYKGAPTNEFKHNRLPKIAITTNDSVYIESYSPNFKRNLLQRQSFPRQKELAEYLDKNQIYAIGGMTEFETDRYTGMAEMDRKKDSPFSVEVWKTKARYNSNKPSLDKEVQTYNEALEIALSSIDEGAYKSQIMSEQGFLWEVDKNGVQEYAKGGTVEERVYAIDMRADMYAGEGFFTYNQFKRYADELSDDEFMYEAETQGLVWSSYDGYIMSNEYNEQGVVDNLVARKIPVQMMVADEYVNPDFLEKGGYLVGDKVKMFEDEPILTITKVNTFSDKKNTYNLKSNDGKIDRKNIPENKIEDKIIIPFAKGGKLTKNTKSKIKHAVDDILDDDITNLDLGARGLSEKLVEKGVIDKSEIGRTTYLIQKEMVSLGYYEEDEYAKGGRVMSIERLAQKLERAYPDIRMRENEDSISVFEDFPTDRRGDSIADYYSESEDRVFGMANHFDNFLKRNGYWAEWVNPEHFKIYKLDSYAKGGKVKSNNNEMIMGGLAGILLGIF